MCRGFGHIRLLKKIAVGTNSRSRCNSANSIQVKDHVSGSVTSAISPRSWLFPSIGIAMEITKRNDWSGTEN
jgi:hypothetical protein